MKREMKKGLVDLMILAVVARGGVSGVDLVETLAELFPPGTIYPAVARLERAGFLEAQRRTAHTGRLRKEYDLTPSGREQLTILGIEWDRLSTTVVRIREEVLRGS